MDPSNKMFVVLYIREVFRAQRVADENCEAIRLKQNIKDPIKNNKLKMVE